MEKKCPYCGALLPEEASFCPNCAQSVNPRHKPKPPFHISVKFLRYGLFFALFVLLFFGWLWKSRPKTYDGKGEITYTDSDGTYQLLISNNNSRYQSTPYVQMNAGDEESYRFPLCLYINHKDSGADASGIFLQKIASVNVQVNQPADSKSPIQCSDPAPNNSLPGSALVSLIDFTRDSPASSQIVWTIHMENKDKLILRMDMDVHANVIYSFSAADADLSTSASLQAFLDKLAADSSILPADTIKLQLPAVTYTESIILPDRSFNLNGTEENGKQTTFAAGIQMPPETQHGWINYFTDITFTGDGSGVGISTARRLWAQKCRFENLKTGVFCYGNTWVNTTDCTFNGNGIGLHYNATDTTPSDTRFTGNLFSNNQTAVLLEAVPSDVRMDFSDCIFRGNKTDIDNRCDQPINIVHATFQ